MLQMLALHLILIVGILPFVFSIWALHRWSRRPYWRSVRRESPGALPGALRFHSAFTPLNLFDPAYFVGDTSCQFNAHSPLLRCAVNPDGPCQSCPHYEPNQHLKPSPSLSR